MPDPAVEAAIERGKAAGVILNRHRDALFPHLHVLLHAFGPVHLRAIAAGAVEAVIVSASANPGDDALLDHCTDDKTILPFGKERP